MAKNRVRKDGYRLSVICSDPATPASGDPVRYGLLTGVALTAEATGSNVSTGNATGYTSVDFGPSEWDLSVKAVDDSGNSAVAVGDLIYYVDADTPKLSKKASGYLFGVAREAINSSATDTINVLHIPSPGSGSVASGAISTTKLAANAVTAAKLSTTLATGFISLPLSTWRLIATNDIPASGSADGGTISKDTAPLLERINGATDKGLRIKWAAAGVVGITNQFAYPPDLDDTAAVTVNLLYYKGSNTDSAMTAAVNYFEGIGDTNAGGNTAALTGTTATKVAVTIAASDVGTYPNVASVEIVPGTHASDILYLLACWIEYTRK